MDKAIFPGKTLAGAARPRQLSEPPSSPPTLNTCVGTGLRRHLCGGMQIFVKTKNSQDKVRMGKQPSSPKEPTRPPARPLPGTPARHGKTLVRSPGKTLAGPPGKAEGVLD